MSGEPFFLNQFLERVHSTGALRFDADTGRWTWDMEAIDAEGITDNVVDLLAERIQRLSDSTGRALSIAACIGNRFDLATLAKVLGSSVLEAGGTLDDALGAELIVLADRQLEMDDELEAEDVEFAYRFIHDRVQQAAHSLLTEDERKRTHYRLGQLLLDSLDDAGVEERLFEIVNHLNAGREQRLRRTLILLNTGAEHPTLVTRGEADQHSRRVPGVDPDLQWARRIQEDR